MVNVGLSEAMSNRDEWIGVKASLEEKLGRLQTAYNDCNNSLYYGEWNSFIYDFSTFKSQIKPSLQISDWEGDRVKEYEQKIENLWELLMKEESKYLNVLGQIFIAIQQCEQEITNAQENINMYQSIIDNWDEGDEEVNG